MGDYSDLTERARQDDSEAQFERGEVSRKATDGEPALTTAEEFAAFLAADRAHVGRLVKKFNVPVQ